MSVCPSICFRPVKAIAFGSSTAIRCGRGASSSTAVDKARTRQRFAALPLDQREFELAAHGNLGIKDPDKFKVGGSSGFRARLL